MRVFGDRLCSSKRPKWFWKQVKNWKLLKQTQKEGFPVVEQVDRAEVPIQNLNPLRSGNATPQTSEIGNKTDMTPGEMAENEKIDNNSVGETSDTGQSNLTCSVKSEE